MFSTYHRRLPRLRRRPLSITLFAGFGGGSFEPAYKITVV